MNVLIIPEDHIRDGLLLKPLFEKLFSELGRPKTSIRICDRPRLRGIGDALNLTVLREIVDAYRMVQFFILCVDRDGDKNRRARLDRIEKIFAGPRLFLAENAWEELETWTLAGLDLPSDWSWADVHAEISVKERYFERLAERRNVANGPGRGRKTLGQEAARDIRAIRQKCPDDFGRLASRLETFIAAA